MSVPLQHTVFKGLPISTTMATTNATRVVQGANSLKLNYAKAVGAKCGKEAKIPSPFPGLIECKEDWRDPKYAYGGYAPPVESPAVSDSSMTDTSYAPDSNLVSQLEGNGGRRGFKIYSPEEAKMRGKPRKVKCKLKTQGNSRSTKRKKLTSASVSRTSSMESGDRDAKREMALDAKEVKEDVSGDAGKKEKCEIKMIPNHLGASSYSDKVVFADEAFMTVCLLALAVMWGCGYDVLMVLVYCASFGVIATLAGLSVCSTLYYAAKGFIESTVEDVFYSVTFDNWTPIGPILPDEPRDVRINSHIDAQKQYTYGPGKQVWSHRRYVEHHWFGFVSEEEINSGTYTLSTTLASIGLQRAQLMLPDNDLQQRINSICSSYQMINLGPADSMIVEATKAFVFARLRYRRAVQAPTDFQTVQGNVGTSSLAIDSGRSASLKWTPKRSVSRLAYKMFRSTISDVLSKLPLDRSSTEQQILMGTLIMCLTLLGLWQSGWVVSQSAQILLCAVGLSALLVIGLAITLNRLTQETSWMFYTGSSPQDTQEPENDNLRICTALTVSGTIVLLTSILLLSASLRTNPIPTTSTFVASTPVLTSSSSWLDRSFPDWKTSFMNIPNSLSTFQLPTELGTYTKGFSQKVQDILPPITLPSKLTSPESFLNSVSSSFTAILPEIIREREKLRSIIVEWQEALTTASSSMFESVSRHVECLEKCLRLSVMDSLTSWSSYSFATFLELKEQIVSLREMIASLELRKQAGENVNVDLKAIEQMIGRVMLEFRNAIIVKEQPVVQESGYSWTLITLMILLVAFIGYLVSMSKSNSIRTFAVLLFAAWFLIQLDSQLSQFQ